MISYEFPSGRNVDGPTQIFARINADSEFASERTLLDQSGSRVRFGDFLVMPIEDSLLYVQPVYVQSAQENSIPELRRVIVVNGDAIGIGSTLSQALTDALGDVVAPPPDDGEPQPPPTGTVDEQVDALLQEAAQHFTLADAALREGDLATYQSEIELAQAAIEQAQALLGGDGATGSPSPSPTP
jgi:hypothetical protein